ncbi:response regulator transcription factor, partial [Streptomyces galbus]|uniref:response regulator transcription factor n=1 Tax=Streptomyces galbus TaxID=33898 RepID=UPI001FF890BB
MTTAPGTVLVVEDEPSIADVLAIALRFHRFEVMTAATVRAALELAGRTRPDVALLDVMLPDGDGRELGRRLRGEQPELGLVFLTARDAPAEIVGGAGAAGDRAPAGPPHLDVEPPGDGGGARAPRPPRPPRRPPPPRPPVPLPPPLPARPRRPSATSHRPPRPPPSAPPPPPPPPRPVPPRPPS